MESGKSRRRLRNVMTTRKHHFSYLGMWVLVVVALVLCLNVMVYIYAEERWAGAFSWDESLHVTYLAHRLQFLLVMGTEAGLLVAATVMLARFTAHRISGPHIQLVNVCHAVRDGDTVRKLKFRDYDKLEEVEEAFNGMLAALRERMAVDRGPGNGG